MAVQAKAAQTSIYKTIWQKNQCLDHLCSYTYNFRWTGGKEGGGNSCTAALICDKLEGMGVCLKFGINMGVEITDRHGQKRLMGKPICTQDHIQLGAIPEGGSINVTLWATNSTFYDANCYVWCAKPSETGRSIPVPPSGYKFTLTTEDLVSAMVSVTIVTIRMAIIIIHGSRSL